jgi:carbon-monoxide dehydrogenase large subunit
MPYDTLPGLGQPLRRLEDPRLLTGGGRYTVNIAAPGALHAVFVRSPYAHALIKGTDTAAAKASPGVRAVFTGADIAAAGLGHNPSVVEIKGVDGKRHIEPPRLPITPDKARHVGEIVAMVVADTLEQARDGAELVEIDYEALDAVVAGDDALKPGAPVVHDEAPGNLLCDWRRGDEAATNAAFAKAAHVVRVEQRGNRILASYLETRAALGRYDVTSGAITLVTPSQGVHLLQRTIAGILNIPRERLRVMTHDVGGGFGPKLPPYPEQILVSFATLQLKRDVRWTQERGEHHLADTHARDLIATAELALDADGRFLAIRADAVANFGAYVSTVNPTIPTGGMAKVLTGLYDIPAAYVAMKCAVSNTAPVDAFRGAGKPETLVMVERLVDLAAHKLGRDPAELRRQNFIRPDKFPYRTSLGFTYDSGDYAALLDAVNAKAEIAGFAARRRASEAVGRKRGIGYSAHIHGTGGWSDETSIITVNTDGSIEAITGTQSQGQGHATIYAQVIAATLGVSPDRVRIVQGDTLKAPRGGGTGGSSSTIISGATMKRAADVVIAHAREQASELLEAAPDDLDYADGTFTIVGTDKRVGLFEIAERKGAIEGRADFADKIESWPTGIAICEVEVDPESGQVVIERFSSAVDVGTVVNPLLLDGQLHGGYAAGIGGALLEDAAYDRESGQLLAGSLMDYALPRADDVPDFAQVTVSTPAPFNILGIKGVGELPTNGAPAAVLNAVMDAIGAHAEERIQLPLTAERVWRLANR